MKYKLTNSGREYKQSLSDRSLDNDLEFIVLYLLELSPKTKEEVEYMFKNSITKSSVKEVFKELYEAGFIEGYGI